MDKSLKPGDVIEMGGVQGRIAQINARYTAVETLDGKAYLIPNESLIGNEVINLSYNDSHLLVRAEVGVAFNADPRAACG
jgi:small-conductance mechanosensitive channel